MPRYYLFRYFEAAVECRFDSTRHIPFIGRFTRKIKGLSHRRPQ